MNVNQSPAAKVEIGPSFEFLGDGSMFIPYGNMPHRVGMQRVNATAAQRMADNLRGVVNQVLRVLTGLPRRAPIYIGHPDVPGRGAEFPDKRSYGWVTDITDEREGMRLAVKWTVAGEQLVRDGHFLFYSPYWEGEQSGRFVDPVKLISVGLTNNPNIPVPALANELDAAAEEESTNDDQPELDPDMKKELAALFGKDETITDEDLLALVKDAKDAADAAAKKPEEEETETETETEEQTETETEEETEEETETETEEEDPEKKKTAENDATDPVKAIRAERVGMVIDSLCLAGKLTVADRGQATETLLACENDDSYAAELARLAAGGVVLKTGSVTDDLAGKGGAVRAENDLDRIKTKRKELLDNEMAGNGGNFNAAWAKMSRRHPELFT